jgi:signal transduction histidine kinase
MTDREPRKTDHEPTVTDHEPHKTDREPGMADREPSMADRLRTVSLRQRVVLSSLAVLGIVLVAVSVLAEIFVGIGSRSELSARLNERAALAEQLVARGTPPDDMIDQLAGPSLRVRLVTPSGDLYGSRSLPVDPDRPAPADPGPIEHRPNDQGRRGSADGGPFGGPADGGGPFGPRAGRHAGPGGPPTGPVVRRTLRDGSRLTLVGDSSDLSDAQRRLARLLLFLGTGGLVVAIIALLITTSVALRPLDAMTGLARQIAGGDRGRRLSPTRTDTELGRTAAAFDDMLDALEGAETQARTAETQARNAADHARDAEAQARDAEAQARTAAAQARYSEERTRRFVADAAHELRTPIAGLRAAAEASLSSRAGGEERDRLQLLLVREAARAGRLVEDLLALARIDAGLSLDQEPVELVGLAEAEAERTRLLAPSVRVVVTGEPLTVHADPGRLTQVLANLLDNARRHTPDGGEISIAVDRLDPDTAGVWVADSGPGVPDADRERIFDRLVRLDEARARDGGSAGGAGLGLSIARGIARAHGGELRCVDGSVFELTLPAD